MPIEYIELEQALLATGVRMIVSKGAPNPWAEAAKALLHVRKIPWKAVYLDQRNDQMAAWSGKRNAPVLLHDDEPPIHKWLDLLNYAQHHGEGPTLIPSNEEERQAVLAHCKMIAGKEGLGWYRRLCAVDKGLKGLEGGFPEFIADYLGKKYGYEAHQAEHYPQEVASKLAHVTDRLQHQASLGSAYLFGESLTAADLYSACFMHYFQPYSDELCAMSPILRPGFSHLEPIVEKAFHPILVKHRDYIYQNFLELPLQL